MITGHVSLPIVPDTDEICRYLGYRGNDPDPAVKDRIRSVTDELNKGITPGFVYSCYPLNIGSSTAGADPVDTVCIRFGPVSARSAALYRNLEGCTRIIVFAATLGTYPDRLQQRISLKSMRDAMIVQACAAAMIEALCNQINEELRQQQEKEGWLMKPRFSPGYGDLSLAVQKDLIHLLDAPKNIGLTLTDSLMMVPTKSVTALIGLYAADSGTDPAGLKDRTENGSGCAVCSMNKTCGYSRI
ncbi:MAG: Vitamin B12 dependent methionine synthase activation subunit [Lachnospiraceae bacterium]|nr:Vitamin B12 dependent methionine synthase activation subunit [Lachnospiraceae bacterium]